MLEDAITKVLGIFIDIRNCAPSPQGLITCSVFANPVSLQLFLLSSCKTALCEYTLEIRCAPLLLLVSFDSH